MLNTDSAFFGIQQYFQLISGALVPKVLGKFSILIKITTVGSKQTHVVEVKQVHIYSIKVPSTLNCQSTIIHKE